MNPPDNKQIIILGSSNMRIVELAHWKTVFTRIFHSEAENIDCISTQGISKTLLISVNGKLETILQNKIQVQLFDKSWASRLFQLNGFYEAIGNDRIANLIGAITHFQNIQTKKLTVVDFGSCTTLTTIAKDENGWKYVDGFIQCGISAMGQSLSRINEALPSISAKIMRDYLVKFDVTVPPSSTERNIVKGVIRSSQALIRELSEEGHSVIVTGGWSLPLEKFIKSFNSSVQIIPDLIVRGGIEYFKLIE